MYWWPKNFWDQHWLIELGYNGGVLTLRLKTDMVLLIFGNGYRKYNIIHSSSILSQKLGIVISKFKKMGQKCFKKMESRANWVLSPIHGLLHLPNPLSRKTKFE